MTTTVPAAIKAHIRSLIAKGAVRPNKGPRYFPKPTKLRGSGKSAVDYISESRR